MGLLSALFAQSRTPVPRFMPGRWFYRWLRSGTVIRRAQVAHTGPVDRSRANFNGAAMRGAEESEMKGEAQRLIAELEAQLASARNEIETLKASSSNTVSYTHLTLPTSELE